MTLKSLEKVVEKSEKRHRINRRYFNYSKKLFPSYNQLKNYGNSSLYVIKKSAPYLSPCTYIYAAENRIKRIENPKKRIIVGAAAGLGWIGFVTGSMILLTQILEKSG